VRVFITGGMGFVGTNLTNELSAKGHQVTVLDRSIGAERAVPEGVSRVAGDSTKPGPWQEQLAEHDVVINLAGASIFQRWNDGVKRAIRDSRILTTRNVVKAMEARKGQETHLFSTSAVGYYGFHGDGVLYEDNPPGTDFMGQIASEWETEALRAADSGARVVITRFGLVLGRRGGVMGQLAPLFRRYMGAQLGNGQQWFSWVHEKDLARIFLALLDRKDLDGSFNCTAPNPVRNSELTHALAQALGKRVILPPAPAFVLRLALGEFAGVILKGQRVIPRRLLDAGFGFAYPALPEALRDLVGSGD
jgi:uncharacterized protein (TIGR01777 family)